MSDLDQAFLLGFVLGGAVLGACGYGLGLLLPLRRPSSDCDLSELDLALAPVMRPHVGGAPLPFGERGVSSLYLTRSRFGLPARDRVPVSRDPGPVLLFPASGPSPSRSSPRPHHAGECVCQSSPNRGDSIHGIRATGPDSQRAAVRILRLPVEIVPLPGASPR